MVVFNRFAPKRYLHAPAIVHPAPAVESPDVVLGDLRMLIGSIGL